MNKTVLIARMGAIGDMIIITPVIEKLHELGYRIVLHTSKRGRQVLKECPHIDQFIDHDEDTPLDKFGDALDKVKKEVNPDVYINFTESIECNVALHPVGPRYIYPKRERALYCDRNYYDVTEEWARNQIPDLPSCDLLPVLYFTEEEKEKAKACLKPGKVNIQWQMSGSGKQKIYPWAEYVIGELLKNYDNLHIITTGDLKSQLLETIADSEITHLSGEIDIRTALCLTQYVDLVVSPDTGVLHASGAFQTPKIGLLGHTSKINITKYFLNDFSIEAKCACAPCFRLIYDHNIQCPIEFLSGAAWCMAEGIKPKDVYERIVYVLRDSLTARKRREDTAAALPDMRV